MNKWKHKLLNFILTFRFVFIFYFLLALFASLQSYNLGIKIFNGLEYTHYNNYLIFKYSFPHLLDNINLYAAYPYEHFDLFKYSPAFALFFGVFKFLPGFSGVFIWNFLNAFVLFLGVKSLPNIQNKTKIFILLFIAIELMTSIQNEQSNGLMAGLLMLSFSGFEKKNYLMGTLFIVLTVFVKIFGAVFFILLLLYPKKFKTAGFTLLWTALLFLSPLIFVSFNHLITQYVNWYEMLASDHSASVGMSVLGILQTWFNILPQKILLLAIGAVLLLLPLIRLRQYPFFNFRLLMFSSVLIWMVIFNHKAESPTFIIAMSGVAIWGMIGKFSITDVSLLVFAFVLTSLSPTDIIPSSFRNKIIIPYALKALPCILIWIRLSFDLVNHDFSIKRK